jgi:hypothetical protein
VVDSGLNSALVGCGAGAARAEEGPGEESVEKHGGDYRGKEEQAKDENVGGELFAGLFQLFKALVTGSKQQI